MNTFLYDRKIFGALDLKEAECIYECILLAPPGVILELGCQDGKSLITIAKADDSRDVYTIDNGSGQGDGFSGARDNLDKYKIRNVVETITADTSEYAQYWSKPIALLYIDAGHTYDDVKRDFESYFPFVVKGGLVLFHDSIHSLYTGVRKYIDEEISKREDIEFVRQVSDTGMGIDVWRKK